MSNMDGSEDLVYEDYDTRGEIIVQCYNSLMAIDLIDTYDRKMQQKKDRTRRKALDVIDYYISEIHAEIFDETYEDE
jgi:regulator of sigma D